MELWHSQEHSTVTTLRTHVTRAMCWCLERIFESSTATVQETGMTLYLPTALESVIRLLVHLSTKCLRWAIVMGGCPASCVVRRASTFWCLHSRGHILTHSSWNLVTMIIAMISRPSSNMGYVGSKTMSSGQILENPCLHSRGHIFYSTFLKLCHNVYYNDI